MSTPDEPIVDVVCSVLARERSQAVIETVLSKFLPKREVLAADYAVSPNAPDYPFANEREMLDYFTENMDLSQSFFWNQKLENPDRLMVGAIFTCDGGLVMTITVPSRDKLPEHYLVQLKQALNSMIGVMWYHDPPPFADAKDFREQYGGK
jgi:hypothetical protein